MPKVRRCYVEVRDANGEKPNRYATVYDATPDQVIERLKGGSGEPTRRVKRPSATATP